MAKHDPDLDRIFQALADPTRRAMLAALAQGPVAVSDLAEPTGLRLPTVMKHLGVLEMAGLIRSEKQGRTRLCAAQPETLARTADWLMRQRAAWVAQTDRLEAFLQEMPDDNNPL